MDAELKATGYMVWTAEADKSINVMRWKGDHPVVFHKHEYIEIAFLASGTCSHTYLGSEVKLIPGDLFVITPHEKHAYDIESETVIYNCMFYPDALGEDWLKLKEDKSIYDLLIVEPFFRTEIGHQEILNLSPSEAYQIEALLRTMIEEHENKKENYQIVQKANLVIFLCYLGRAWKNQLVNSKNEYKGKRDLLAQAVDYIEKNINDQITIQKLASKTYLSPSYFRKIFKEVTGRSPIDYINEIRISRARDLLLKEDLSVAEVAEFVGISDHNYFSKLFKMETGCSPSDYRKNRSGFSRNMII